MWSGGPDPEAHRDGAIRPAGKWGRGLTCQTAKTPACHIQFLSLHFLIFLKLTERTKEWNKVEMQFRPPEPVNKDYPHSFTTEIWSVLWAVKPAFRKLYYRSFVPSQSKYYE